MIVVAGELYLDMILSGFDIWPQLGKEAFAQEFHREIGGGAAITACGLAKLGSPTALLGVVGTDSGQWIVERLRHAGVGTDTIQFDEKEATAFTVVASTSEDRAFLTYIGANRRFPALLIEAAKGNSLTGARHVHLAYPPPLDTANELFEAIHRSGVSISLDLGWQEAWLSDPRALSVLSHVDLFFPNEIEAQCLTGEVDAGRSLRKMEDAGLKRVALKLGAQGSALLWDGKILTAGPHPATPVDTTGAGDCFDAGFLHAWIAGHPVEACLRTANICGALSTEAYGGINGFPSPGRLAQELAKGT